MVYIAKMLKISTNKYNNLGNSFILNIRKCFG